MLDPDVALHRALATLLIVWHIQPVVAFDGDDFSNNLFSDLGPIISLLGELPTIQFMSQAMGLADCIIVAIAPLGIITIIVSAIRVGGPQWLKAIIGRGREHVSAGEVELMSSTSKETCELWNGYNLVRCRGEGRIQQFICVAPKDWRSRGLMDIEPMTLKKATTGGKILQERETCYSTPLWNKLQGFCTSSWEKKRELLRGLRNKLRERFANSWKTARQLFIRLWKRSRPTSYSTTESQNLSHSSQTKEPSSQETDLERGDGKPSTAPPASNNNSPAVTTKEKQSSTGLPDNQSGSCKNKGKIQVIRDDSSDAAPNLYLNLHDTADRRWIYLLAIFGVVLQAGVLAYFYCSARDKSLTARLGTDNAKDASRIGVPLSLTGTLVLMVGLIMCAIVVDQSTTETHYYVGDDKCLWVVWIQQDNVVEDQVFRASAIYPREERRYVTTSRRRDASNEEKRGFSFGLKAMTVLGTGLAIAGFVLQFIGLRDLNWSASLVQLGAVGLMTCLRALVRIGFFRRPASTYLTPGFELDWLAVNLARPASAPWVLPETELSETPADEIPFSWTVIPNAPWSRPEGTSETSTNEIPFLRPVTTNEIPDHTSKDPGENMSTLDEAQHIMMTRKSLSDPANWKGPAHDEAIRLSQAMEAVMETFPLPKIHNQNVDYFWGIKIHHQEKIPHQEKIHHQETPVAIRLTWGEEEKKWKVDSREIDSLLSLWMYSVHCQSDAESIRERGIQAKSGSVFQGSQEVEKGLRLFGFENKALKQDLDWWMPPIAPELQVVEFIKVKRGNPEATKVKRGNPEATKVKRENLEVTKGKRENLDETKAAAREISRQRIVGLDPQRLNQLGQQQQDNEFREESATFHYRILRSKPPNKNEDDGNVDDENENEDNKNEGKKNAGKKNAGKKNADNSERLSARESKDPLDRLYAQNLLQGFFRAVVSLPDVKIDGKSTISSGQLQHWGNGWDSFKLSNDNLVALANEIERTGFGSLSDVYFDLVIPLSMESKTPNADIVIGKLHDLAQQHELSRSWSSLVDVCENLYNIAEMYNPQKNHLSPRAFAICLEYTNRYRTAAVLAKFERRFVGSFDDERYLGLEKKIHEGLRQKKVGDSYDFQLAFHAQGQDPLDELLQGVLPRGEFTQKVMSKREFIKTEDTLSLKNLDVHKIPEEHDFPRSFRMTDCFLVAMGLKAPCKWRDGEMEDAFGWRYRHYLAAQGLGKEPLPHGPCGLHPHKKQAPWEWEKGPMSYKPTIFGYTLLHYTFFRNHKTLHKHFLRHGGDINAAAGNGITPMHCAVNGGKSLIERLIKLSSDPKAKEKVQTSRDPDGKAPIHWASMKGLFDVVELWKDSIELTDCYGRTCLHLATLYQHEELVKKLIELGANKQAKDFSRQTPLHLATMGGHISIIEILLPKESNVDPLKNGPKIDTLETRLLEIHDFNSNTPLHFAVQYGKSEAFKYFAEVAPQMVARNKKRLLEQAEKAEKEHPGSGILDVVRKPVPQGRESIPQVQESIPQVQESIPQVRESVL